MERFKAIPAVYIIFEQDKNNLFLKRKNTGYEDGNFSLVSGHVDGEESLESAAIREAREEVGVEIEDNNLELVHVMHRSAAMSDGKDERLDFYFKCLEWAGEITNIEPEKCEELLWSPTTPDDIAPLVAIALNGIANGKLYSEAGWE